MDMSSEDEAVGLAVDALGGLGLDTVTVDGGFEITLATLAWTIVAALVPVIRADEREQCLQAVRSMPEPAAGIHSSGYRAGYAAARDDIAHEIHTMPVRIGLDRA